MPLYPVPKEEYDVNIGGYGPAAGDLIAMCGVLQDLDKSLRLLYRQATRNRDWYRADGDTATAVWHESLIAYTDSAIAYVSDLQVALDNVQDALHACYYSIRADEEESE